MLDKGNFFEKFWKFIESYCVYYPGQFGLKCFCFVKAIARPMYR